ncbi:MAG TPA: hypothetical protein VHX68_15410 [Planctomycetaceae bacterium]|jgi:hypothetical protein|nr:hypothetical protein [Planctomycetaceae bacterium]
MSRTRICCVCLVALIGQTTLVVVCEPAIGMVRADEPKGNADQPKNRRPRARNAQAPKKESKPPADANLLSMELKALRILRGLEATPNQISEIARAAKTTAGSPGQRESAKVSGPYLEAMVQMRRALVAKDDDKIEALRTQFDQLEEKDRPDLDDQVEITDGAEIEGVRLLSIFSPLQIVAYAQSLEDDFPDPVQLIAEGLGEGRELKNEEWETARTRLAEEVGWLVGGLQGDKALKIEERVSAFLNEKHGAAGKAGDREPEIRKLLGSPGPLVILQNLMEHTLAELLSNPRIERAARDCLRPGPRAVPREKVAEAAAAKTVAAGPPPAKNHPKRPHHPESKSADTTAKRVALGDVVSAPNQYEGQEVQFDDVTVTGTAPARLAANLWLAVKTAGTVVDASRGQKLTFVIPIAKTPEVIKELKSGESGVAATLMCIIRRDGRAHWAARVQSVKVHGNK